jgi:hypothetical protein
VLGTPEVHVGLGVCEVCVRETLGDEGDVVAVERGADVVALRDAEDDDDDALELGVGVDSFCPPVISCLVAIGNMGCPAR